MGRRAVIGRPLTASERMKMTKLRRDGTITPETTPAEIDRLLRTFKRPGPAKSVGYTDAQRKKLKRARGKTITEMKKDLKP